MKMKDKFYQQPLYSCFSMFFLFRYLVRNLVYKPSDRWIILGKFGKLSGKPGTPEIHLGIHLGIILLSPKNFTEWIDAMNCSRITLGFSMSACQNSWIVFSILYFSLWSFILVYSGGRNIQHFLQSRWTFLWKWIICGDFRQKKSISKILDPSWLMVGHWKTYLRRQLWEFFDPFFLRSSFLWCGKTIPLSTTGLLGLLENLELLEVSWNFISLPGKPGISLKSSCNFLP